MEVRDAKITLRFDLPGGQDRLRQMILHVADKCRSAERFGFIKLNKILWKADFNAFAARGRPVTGREYTRQKFGPVPKEMLPLHREMKERGLITIEMVDFGDDIVEHRTLPLRPADLARFTKEDLEFVASAIGHYWNMSGMESSDDSHGVAWQTRTNGEPMPYEAAFLSDRPLSRVQLAKARERAAEHGWFSE